jgi:hypothetical protein
MSSISGKSPIASTSAAAMQDDTIEPAPLPESQVLTAHQAPAELPQTPGPPLLPARRKPLLRKVRTAINKLRQATVVSSPLGVYTRAADRPAVPDVRGREQAPPKDQAASPLGPRQQARLDGRFKHSAAALIQPPPLTRLRGSLGQDGVLPPPGSATAAAAQRTSDAACRGAIDALFGTTAGPSLGARLLDDFQQVFPGEAERAREAAVLVGQGLACAMPGHADRAHAAWAAMVADDAQAGAPVQQRRDVNDGLRALASSDLAFDALWALKSHRGHASAQAGHWEETKFALQTSDELLRQGVDLGVGSAHASADFIAHATARSAAAGQLGGQEAADVLACRTLLCATREMDGTGAPTAAELAACMAWRSGFTTSGPGSDFNQAVHGMHRFTSWARQALKDREPGAWNHVKRWVRGLGQAVKGTGQSPWRAASLGTMGAELPELARGRERFEAEMRGALQQLQAALANDAQRLSDAESADPRPLGKAQARHAVVSRLLEHGPLRKNFKLDGAAREQITAQLAGAGLEVPPKLLAKVLGERITLSMLERWAGDSVDAGSAQEATFKRHVDEARWIAKGRTAKARPEDGLDAMRELAMLALDTEGVQLRHELQRGVQGGVVFNLRALGTELSVNVGPVARLLQGRRATVRIGTTTIGSDVFMGSDTRWMRMLGVASSAGLNVEKIDHASVTLGFASVLRHTWETSEGEGVSIRASKNCKRHKQLVGEAVDFLFKQADARRRHKIDGPELWERFSNAFINEPDVVIEKVGTRAAQRRTGAAAGLGARLGLFPFTVGPFASAGVEYVRGGSVREEPASTGSKTAAKESQLSAQALATVAGTVVAQVAIHGVELLSSLRFPALVSGSARMDFSLAGGTVQVRLTVEDGRVQPKLSLAQRQFQLPHEMLSYAESVRADWEPLVGKARFDRFLRDLRALPGEGAAGNRVHQERRRLTDAAARELSVLLAQRSLQQRQGATQPVQATEEAMAEVLGDALSWVPEKLAVSEVASRYVETGIELVGALRSRLTATSTNRYLLQLKPG